MYAKGALSCGRVSSETMSMSALIEKKFAGSKPSYLRSIWTMTALNRARSTLYTTV